MPQQKRDEWGKKARDWAIKNFSTYNVGGLIEKEIDSMPDVDFSILTSSLTTTNSATGFDNQSTGASSYVWSFGDGSPESYAFEPTNTFPNDEAGTYEVTLTGTSDEGCVNQDIQYVYVLQDYTIYVPNAFTPDASNLNDVFKPEMEGFDEFDFVMYIFNRWGELVFETHDMEVGWDGTFTEKGIVCQDGVYTWKIVAKLADSDDNKLFAGHVSLLK